MALSLNKFILPDGAPSNSVQITKSSSIGPSDLWDFGIYQYVHSGLQVVGGLGVTGGTLILENNDNGAGSFISSPDEGPNHIWNTATNRFDFSSLAVGDMIDIHLQMQIDPDVNNQIIDLYLDLGVGGTQRSIQLMHTSAAKSTTYVVSTYKGFFLMNSSEVNNPARLSCTSDADLDIDSLYFYCKLIRKGRTA